MRSFAVLTDIEFEGLVADLLSEELGRHVERFSCARDGGIDLRWKTGEGGDGIGQVKHHVRSSFSQLRAAAKEEAKHLHNLLPVQYIFITSFDLSKTQKDKVYGELSKWMSGPADVLGGRDVDALLTRHPTVERQHPKLWLASGTQLFWATHADILNRSSALEERIERNLHR